MFNAPAGFFTPYVTNNPSWRYCYRCWCVSRERSFHGGASAGEEQMLFTADAQPLSTHMENELELLRTCSALLFSGKAFLCWREQRREPKATEVRRLGKGAFKTFFAAFMWTEKERHCFPTTFQLVIINLLSSEIVTHLPLKFRKRFAAQRKWS